jgi:hypothetical protein
MIPQGRLRVPQELLPNKVSVDDALQQTLSRLLPSTLTPSCPHLSPTGEGRVLLREGAQRMRAPGKAA